MDLAAQLADPAPALRKIDELEAKPRALTAELERLEKDSMRDAHRESLKDILGTLAERIELHPETLKCRLHYRIGIENRNKMASPRGLAHYINGFRIPIVWPILLQPVGK